MCRSCPACQAWTYWKLLAHLLSNLTYLPLPLFCCLFSYVQELSSLMAELSGVDLLEATRTDERSTREELRCVLAVVRHGDRTPKQKLKVSNG
jgi:hypothetical protein